MKKIITLLLALLLNGLYAQEVNNYIINYDQSGNIIERKIQVVVEASGRMGKPVMPKDSIPAPMLFKVFPNPANEYVTIEGPLPEGVREATYELQTITGSVLKKGVYAGRSTTIYVGGYKIGLYVLSIRYSKKEVNSYKIIITH